MEPVIIGHVIGRVIFAYLYMVASGQLTSRLCLMK
jgi:hypothetical protein